MIKNAIPDSARRVVYRARRQLSRAINAVRAADGTLRYFGVLLHVDPDAIGPSVAHNLLCNDYEVYEVRMLKMFLQPGDTVIELGAGMGFIGLYCASVVGGQNVHSFEANPAMEAVIRKNYALNPGHDPNLTIGFLKPDAREGETQTFYVPKEFWAASLSPMDGATEVETPCLRLDSELDRIKPSFMVMDIEGGEIEILSHLDQPSVRKIAVELHPEVTSQPAIDAMVAKLALDGFEVKWRSRAGRHMYFERNAM